MAYDVTINSYSLAERRLDVIEKRLQDMIMFGVTASVALLALLAKARKVDFYAWQFIGATACFLAAIIIGTVARLSGKLQMIHPSELYAKYLCLEAAEFKRRIIYWGGQAHTANQELVTFKARLTAISVTVLLAEFTLLAWWAVRVATRLP